MHLIMEQLISLGGWTLSMAPDSEVQFHSGSDIFWASVGSDGNLEDYIQEKQGHPVVTVS